MSVHMSQVAMTLAVKVPHTALEKHLPASAEVVGEQLAKAVSDYAREHALGYYPPLDFFQEHGGIDEDLLQAATNISWIVTGLARNEIRTRMRPVMSNVQFQSLQTVAFTMPTVRPGQNNALYLLQEHFTPDVVKITLLATLIQRFEDSEAAETMARSMAYRWLRNHFEHVDVTSVHYIEKD